MSAAAAVNEDRKISRRWIINETVEILVGDIVYDFQITDVSAGGAIIISDMDLEPGMKVMLQLSGSLQLTAKFVTSNPMEWVFSLNSELLTGPNYLIGFRRLVKGRIAADFMLILAPPTNPK